MKNSRNAVWAVAIAFFAIGLSIPHYLVANAQSPTRDQAVAFVQDTLLNKAGGSCSPTSTPLAFGGSISQTVSTVYPETSNPAVDENGILHFIEFQDYYGVSPGFIGVSASNTLTMMQVDITLSNISPNSIIVKTGYPCGLVVHFEGTSGKAIVSGSSRWREFKGISKSMNADPSNSATRQEMKEACSDKEKKKKICREGQLSNSEYDIVFRSNPDMAPRFAHALHDLVVMSGGRDDAY